MEGKLGTTVAVFFVGLALVENALAQSKVDGSQRSIRGFTLTMQREACFGSCPIYSVIISGNGRVRYKGTEFVRVKGERQYRISTALVEQLIREIRAVDFFSLKDSYRSVMRDGVETSVTDQPTTTIKVTLDGKTKTVVDYYGTPESVITLEDRIGELAGVKRLVGTK